MPTIDHVFVLMLENRSFDHMFGLSGLVPRPPDPDFGPGAPDRMPYDPPHEFADVQAQVRPSGDMRGFPPQAKCGLLPSQVPVVTQLAREFVLMDNWYASVPGPTWPNRFFVHAGSSGGLADSPGNAVFPVLGIQGYRFARGTVFDQLQAAGRSWTVAHGDDLPQVLAIDGMAPRLFDGRRFRPLRAGADGSDGSDFFTDLATGRHTANYCFIEPDYGIRFGDPFGHGDSQHPTGSVAAGEQLIKDVYEAIRNSTLWPRSVLLVVWDEHGGFFDGAQQLNAAAPGDPPLNARHNTEASRGFDFRKLGVRVPALLISPFAPRGRLGSQLFPGAAFDHASVVASLRETFALPGPLTERDRLAPTWTTGLSDQARTGADLPPTRLVAPHAGPDPVPSRVGPGPAAPRFGSLSQDMKWLATKIAAARKALRPTER